MDEKIVFEGKTKEGKEYIFRYPRQSDAPLMLAYINAISKEQTYTTFQGEQLAINEEEEYLAKQLKRISTKETVQLLVVVDDKVIGASAVDLKEKIESHVGIFGITLAKEFRDKGIGTKLMEAVLKEAQKKMPKLKIITLNVFGNNTRAYDMYKKFGFEEYGRLPKGLVHRGKYVDHISMYKKIETCAY